MLPTLSRLRPPSQGGHPGTLVLCVGPAEEAAKLGQRPKRLTSQSARAQTERLAQLDIMQFSDNRANSGVIWKNIPIQ